MPNKKKIKKKEVDPDELWGCMKGVFPEDMETTEIVEKIRTEWAKKLVYGAALTLV